MLSIEVFSNGIGIVEGRISGASVSVTNFAELKFSSEVMTDGMINDESEFTNQFKNILKQYNFTSKDVQIFFNIPSIIYKELILPQASQKETNQMIYNELDQVSSFGTDYLVKHIQLSNFIQDGAKMVRLLVMALPSKIVSSYALAVNSAGLKLNKVSVAGEVAIDYVRSYGNRNEATILAKIDDTDTSVYLIEGDGKFFFRNTKLSNASAMSSDSYVLAVSNAIGGEANQFIERTVDSISKVVQFQNIKNRTAPVNNVFLFGYALSSELSEAISSSIDVRCTSIQSNVIRAHNPDFPQAQFFLPAYALARTNKLTVDFKDIFVTKQREKKKSMQANPIMWALCIVVTIGIVGYYGYLWFAEYKPVADQIAADKAYVNDPQNKRIYKQKIEEKQKKDQIDIYNSNCSDYVKYLNNIGKPESGQFNNLELILPQDVRIYSYSYQDGVMLMDGYSSDPDYDSAAVKVRNFLDKLQNNGYIYEKYTGITLDEIIKGYKFQVSVRIKS